MLRRLLHSSVPLILAAILVLFLLPSAAGALEPGKRYNFKGKDGQNFKGAVLIREEDDAWIIKLYFADQEVKILKKDLVGEPTPFDQKAPQVTVEPASGRALNTVTNFRFKFSEAVTGAGSVGSYEFTGGGRNNLKAANVKKISDTEYVLETSGTPGNGKINLLLKGIADKSGNKVSQTSFSYTMDTQTPSVKSTPGAGAQVKGLEEIKLLFSESMRGVANKGNYQLEGPASSTLAVDSVSVANGNKAVTLELTGETPQGQLLLVFSNIHDAAGNVPLPKVIEYNIDQTKPRWKTFPACGSTVSQFTSLDVVLSEKIKDPQSTDGMSLGGAGAGSLNINKATSLDGQSIRLSFGGEPGLGELNLTLPEFADEAGNVADGRECNFKLVRASLGAVTIKNEGNNPAQKGSYYRFPGQHVALTGSFAFLSGEYAQYYPNGIFFGMKFEYDLRWPLQNSRVFKDNPLSPALIVDISYHTYSENNRTLSGILPSLGPIWYLPFYPQKGGRIGFSVPMGMTFFTIEGKTFTGSLRAFFLAPGLEYQYFYNRVLFGLGFRQNIVLDSDGSLFSKSINLSVGWAF